MDDPTTTATLDQADEDILTYTASDEALEAAAGIERGADASYYPPQTQEAASAGGLFALSAATRKGVVLHGHLLQRINQVLAHRANSNRAEHVRSAQKFQTSTCSAMASASSTSIPRYRTVLSNFECPSKSWTARRLLVRR